MCGLVKEMREAWKEATQPDTRVPQFRRFDAQRGWGHSWLDSYPGIAGTSRDWHDIQPREGTAQEDMTPRPAGRACPDRQAETDLDAAVGQDVVGKVRARRAAMPE